jgi:nucleoside-diphosphate-sugar epimerase
VHLGRSEALNITMIVGITGSSGFIGSALLQRHLGRGDEVRYLTRSPGKRPDVACGAMAITGDITRPDDALIRFADGLDVLYHAAAELRDPTRMYEVNVGGTRALLTAAAGRIGRWVQLSSAGVYGPRRDGVVLEDTPLSPLGGYEETKAAADALVFEAAREGRLTSAVALRPSIVFGEGMPNQSIAQMARMIDSGLFFFIGDPGASANYVHRDNVVDALVLCATAPAAAGRVYNVSDWCSVEDFVGAIAAALGRRPPSLRLPERPVRAAVRTIGRLAALPLTESRVDALVNRCRYPIARLENELGYRIGVPIAEGIHRMLAPRRAA